MRDLIEGYRFLRMVEHRLQMIDDQHASLIVDEEVGARGLAVLQARLRAEEEERKRLRDILQRFVDTDGGEGGFIARTAPQINVFVIGFPVKVGMGILLLGISLPFFVYVFTKLVHAMENNIMILLRYL